MDRDPGNFETRDDAEAPVSTEDARIDALLASLPPAPGIKHVDDDDDDAADDARAMADFAAGRCYPHAVVGEWLMTWGKPGRLPFKEWLANRDG